MYHRPKPETATALRCFDALRKLDAVLTRDALEVNDRNDVEEVRAMLRNAVLAGLRTKRRRRRR